MKCVGKVVEWKWNGDNELGCKEGSKRARAR